MGQLTKTRITLLGLAILLGSLLAASPPATAQGTSLTVTQTGPTTAAVGDVLTFTVTITNTGSVAATDVRLEYHLYRETAFNSVTIPANWSCSTMPAVGTPGGSAICTLAGSFAPADSTTFTFVSTAVGEDSAAKNDAAIFAGSDPVDYASHDYTIGATPAPTPTPTPTPTVAPTPTPTVAPAPTPTVEPAPSVEPAPTTEPTTRPEPTPTVDGDTGAGAGAGAGDGDVGAGGGAAPDGDVGAGGGAAPEGASLPATGSDATTMSMLAMVAIVVGALLMTGGLVLRPDAIAATARHARSMTGRRGNDQR